MCKVSLNDKTCRPPITTNASLYSEMSGQHRVIYRDKSCRVENDRNFP